MMKKTALTAISFVLLAACGMPDQKTSRLRDTLRYYDTSLRWGEYSKARQMQADDTPGESVEYDGMRNIKVTDMKPLEEKRSEDGDLFERTLEISYYKEAEYSLKTVRDQQIWRYDPDKKLWLREGDMPDFR